MTYAGEVELYFIATMWRRRIRVWLPCKCPESHKRVWTSLHLEVIVRPVI